MFIYIVWFLIMKGVRVLLFSVLYSTKIGLVAPFIKKIYYCFSNKFGIRVVTLNINNAQFYIPRLTK